LRRKRASPIGWIKTKNNSRSTRAYSQKCDGEAPLSTAQAYQTSTPSTVMTVVWLGATVQRVLAVDSPTAGAQGQPLLLRWKVGSYHPGDGSFNN
jgi:hypothetical protein